MKNLLIFGLAVLLVACGDTQQSTQSEAVSDEKSMSEAGDEAEAAAPAISEVLAAPEASVVPGIDKTDPDWKLKVTEPEMMSFEAGKTYFWLLETNHGLMTFELFHDASPMHVTSTIYLTELGFYDDIIFHRVIPGFMAQGGDPTGTGRGGPAYKYDGEFAAGLSHTSPGLLSMANAGPGTDGSQFFITFVPTPFLDGKHTIFGELTEGLDVLKALEARGSRSGATSEELKILSAKIMIQ